MGRKAHNKTVVFHLCIYPNTANERCLQQYISMNEEKNTDIIRLLLRNFILGIKPYNFEYDEKKPLNGKMDIHFSILPNDNLYDWYMNYIFKCLNKNGTIKDILYYQVTGNISRIRIGIDNYREHKEEIAPKGIENEVQNKTEKKVEEGRNIKVEEETKKVKVPAIDVDEQIFDVNGNGDSF